MPRIDPVTTESADADQQQVLETAKAKLGSVPNIIGTLARSPAAANAYFSLSGALAKSSISAAQREQLSLAIAGANSCGYCASAHTAIGASVGVDQEEARRNVQGQASDEKTQALIDLALVLVHKRGFATDDDLASARDAGVTDPQILEVIAVVALNIFTNYTNHVAETAIDFPEVEVPAAANA